MPIGTTNVRPIFFCGAGNDGGDTDAADTMMVVAALTTMMMMMLLMTMAPEVAGTLPALQV